MNGKFLIIVLIAIAFFVIVGLSGCIEQPPAGGGTGSGTGGTGGGLEPAPAIQQGTLLLAVKDARPDWNLIASVNLAVSKVEIHSQGTDSWIVLSSELQEFELLELQDVQALLAEKDLNAGTYNQLRLSVDSVKVDYNGIVQDAKLPSNELKLNLRIVIDENSTSIAVLDFDLNKSLHITGNGKIIMLPVLKVVSEKNVRARIEERNKVRIEEHGVKVEEKEVGTDLQGNTGEEIEVEEETELEIDEQGKIKEKELPEQAEAQGRATGRIIATIKDKPARTLLPGRLDVSELKELNITIDSLTVHFPNSSDENTASWIELLSEEKTFNLLDLQDREALLADVNASIGTFIQVRLGVKEAIAVIFDSNADVNADANATSYSVKIPSKKLRLVSRIIVDENSTSYFNIDFDLNKSLHVTGNEQVIMKPVIKILSKSKVQADSIEDENVQVEGGAVESEEIEEFDEEGDETVEE